MNKRFLLISLSVLSIATVMQARSRSVEDARQVAASFYQGQNGLRAATVPELKLVYRGTENGLRSTTSEAPFYVFNVGSADGFVMVSGDDRVAPVIGYSLTGSFDADDMPDNLRGWLEGYEKQIEYARTLPDKPYEATETRAGDFPQSVEPLVTTKWDQGSPYNNDCPVIANHQRALTGCVATSAAQIMNYHKWPDKAKGTGSYTAKGKTETVDMTKFDPFDWGNMADTYDRAATKEQKAAVANLMAACGAAARMGYGLDASGAQTPDVATGLINNFDYDPKISYIMRDIYTTDEWVSMIKGELVGKRPVLYAGSTNEGGHAFVCDGYDASNRFHFNWGWSGYSDGYYLLDLLHFDNPALVPNIGFSMGQGAVIGIQKAGAGTELEKKEELIIRSFEVKETEISKTGNFVFSLALQWMSSTSDKIKPQMEFRKGEQTVFTITFKELDFTDVLGGWYNFNDASVSLASFSNLFQNGDYRIVFVYTREGSETVHEAVYSKAAIHTDWKVTVTDAKMIWKPVSAELTGSISKIQTWTDDFVSVKTKLHNKSSFDISPVIGFHLYSTDEAGVDEYFYDDGQVYLAPQEETEVELFFHYALKAGKYAIEAVQANDFMVYSIEGTTVSFTFGNPTANETISANDFSICAYTDRIAVQSASPVRLIELFDITGRLAGTIRGANELPVGGLTGGVYIVRVTTDEGIRTEKVVLRR